MELIQELDALHLMLSNARQHAIIQPQLARYGYDDLKIQQGLDILTRIREQQRIQNEEYAECNLASNRLKVEFKNLRQQFTDHRTLASIALRSDENAYLQLRLHIVQEKKMVPWLEQVKHFYDTAALHQKQLSRFGLTKAQLEQSKNMLNSIQEKRQQHLRHKGNAQHATHSRDLTLDSLRKWNRSFRAVARVALEKEPQLLESLGIVVASK